MMTAASKSQLEMNAAAALAGLSIPSNDTLMYGDYCLLERHMFGEMEITFPMKLMSVLESKKYHAILSWSTDEKAFVIKKQEEFENIVLPECFNLSKFSSFLRKLYRWGFSKSKMHASRKCPAYANTAFKRGDVKGCIDISTTPTNYSTIDTKPIERSPGPPYPTKFDSSRSDHLVGLYEQQHAHITFKVTPSKSLGREGGLRFDNFSLLSPKSLPSLTDSVKRSRRRHEQIIAACFNNLTMQRARQELLKQKRRNVMLSLELMRMKQQQMRR